MGDRRRREPAAAGFASHSQALYWLVDRSTARRDSVRYTPMRAARGKRAQLLRDRAKDANEAICRVDYRELAGWRDGDA